MKMIEKLYTFLILLSALLGIFIGQTETNLQWDYYITPLLVVMLYIAFLQIPFKQFTASFKNIRFTTTAILMNFIWTPVLAWSLAYLFLSDHPMLWIGFIMLMVTPCTDWYIIFTRTARGNIPLSASILPVNLILQVTLLPVYLLMFTDTTGILPVQQLIESIIYVLVIPLSLAWVTNLLLNKQVKLKRQLQERTESLPIVLLCLAVIAMFASQGRLLTENLGLLWLITLPLARNSPIALAIALTTFPEEPLIALTLIIGPLLELPLLAFFTQLLLWLKIKWQN
jgi:ACR3 family arsenite efflux pump ArsB